MNRKTTILRAGVALCGAALMAGCNSDPTPPTIDNAKTMWHHIYKQSGLSGNVELVDMKKTNGQMATMNGVKVYTLYYVATERYLTPFGGTKKPGDTEIVRSNYGFTRTEKGWLATDGELF